MTIDTIYVDKKSGIPLHGVDFIGIIDRGTNVLEVKPLTFCNLRCKYCFVSAGDYLTNFIADHEFIVEKLEQLVEIKGRHGIEIHIAPYGEILLYPRLFELLEGLWRIKGVDTISMQSNGLLLTEEIVSNLDKANLTRINISLNTLNKELAEKLCNCERYDVDNLLKNIENLLRSKIDVLLAPVWFPKVNDDDIENIVQYVKDLRSKGFSAKKIQIGIQKYLTYRTGRKLRNVSPKDWKFFYNYLTRLEKKFDLKLKLGPIDFGIQKRPLAASLNLQKNDTVKLEVVSKGRWDNECIGKIDENYGIKVLLKSPLSFSPALVGKHMIVRIIKANYKDNIITALYPA